MPDHHAAAHFGGGGRSLLGGSDFDFHAEGSHAVGELAGGGASGQHGELCGRAGGLALITATSRKQAPVASGPLLGIVSKPGETEFRSA